MFITSALIGSFHEGGWPMFPILVLGLLLLVAAGRYALSPDARYLPVVRNLFGITLLFGVLGTVLGVIHTLSAIQEVPQELTVKIALMGLGESLNNLSLALFLNFFAGILTCVGALRAADRA